MLYFHSYPSEEKNTKEPRVTFAGEFKDGYLYLAAARCTNKDSFLKKKGRQIAVGRYIKAAKEDKWDTDFTAKIKVEEQNIPTWVDICKKLSVKIIETKSIKSENTKVSFMQKIRNLVGY